MIENPIQVLTGILQGAAFASSPKEQVQIIVDAISDAIAIDVCSLYRQNNDGDMVLLASHGLSISHPVVIPANRGLVGRVVKLRHSINMIDPEKHPAYFYVSRSKEEQFHSFCGVPLVYHGEIIGVLVVQSRRSELLAADQENLLITLAAHLALLVAALPEHAASTAVHNDHHRGIRGAPGIAIGAIKVLDNLQLTSVLDTACDDVDKELSEWHALKISVTDELKEERKIIERAAGEGLAGVLEAYQMLLGDFSFGDRIEKEIRAGKSLPWALKQTVKYFSDQFLTMNDSYLRARHEDIDQLGEKLYQAWLCRHETPAQDSYDGATVLVGHQVSVSDIASLPTEHLAAIVCFGGAALSHIAVFANALGIPAVMSVGKLAVRNGDQLIVDGDNGEIILKPGDAVLDEYRAIVTTRQAFDRVLFENSDQPAETLDGVHVELLANSGLQADIMPGIRSGADGIGLYRTEIPFMIRQNLPSEDDQVSIYRQVIEAYQDKPVYIRTLDAGADKPLPYLPKVNEENPALGLRGLRFTLDNIQILITQFRAIMRAAAGAESIRLMLPMISSTAELNQSISLLDEAYEQLLEENQQVCRPPLGVMVEVPGVISMLPYWCDKLDFLSIGSNDLSQYLLAVDRNNPLVARYYDSLHPAVIHELLRIVTYAKQCRLPVSICGEMGSDPVAVMLLLGMGVRKLSMSSAKLPRIKWLIRSLEIADTEKFLQAALALDNAQSIRNLGRETMRMLGIDYEKLQVT
jgi:phosphotransferase system enzyme I (PtsI)/phosphotransferase system enzyme I (PtsP)